MNAMLKDRKIKVTILVTVCLLFLASNTSSAYSQSSLNPDKTVISFYDWYVNSDRNSGKNAAKIKSFVTLSLYLKGKKAQDSLDGDFYTREIAGVTVSPGTVKILGTKTSKNKSVVQILLKGNKNYDDEPDIVTEVKLKVTLIKEKGIWKINELEEI